MFLQNTNKVILNQLNSIITIFSYTLNSIIT